MSTDPKSGPASHNDASASQDGPAGRLPSGGWTMGPWDEELPPAPSSPTPPAVSASSETPSPADTSLGERSLDLASIARSMSAVSRPSPRRETGQHDKVPMPASASNRPGLPPSPRHASGIDEGDRGVSVPLPPGLKGVARPSPSIGRPSSKVKDWDRSPTRTTDVLPLASNDLLTDEPGSTVAADDDSGGGPWRRGSSVSATSLPRIGQSDPNFSELPLDPQSLFGGDAEDEFLLMDVEPDPEPDPPAAPTQEKAKASSRAAATPPELPDPNSQTMLGIAAATLDRVGSSPRHATIAESDELLESIDVLMEMPLSEVTEHDPSSATVVPLGEQSSNDDLFETDAFDDLPTWTDPLQRLPTDGDSDPGESVSSAEIGELADEDLQALSDEVWPDERPSPGGVRPPDTDRGIRRVPATTLEVKVAESAGAASPRVAESVGVSGETDVEFDQGVESAESADESSLPDAESSSAQTDVPSAIVETPPAITAEILPAPSEPATPESEVAQASPDADESVPEPALESAKIEGVESAAGHEADEAAAAAATDADAALHEEPEVETDDDSHAEDGADFSRGDVTRIEDRPEVPEASPARRVVTATGAAFAVSELIELPLPEPSARAELRLDPTTAHHSNVWMNDEERFDALAESLRKAGRWPALAAVLAAVIDGAPFALGARRPALLRELGQLGRDRLAHDALAEESFVALLRLQPGDDEAYQHLLVLYESRSDGRSRTILELHTVPGLTSANEQLARTSRAANNAAEQLQDPDLAIAGWEQLLSLGRHAEECALALGRLYRLRARWDSLAALVDGTAARTSGGARWLSLRLLANVHSRARGDAAGAANALQEILKDRGNDIPAKLMLVEQLAALGDIDALAALPVELTPEPTESEVRAVRRAADLLWEHGRHQDASESYQTLSRAGLATPAEEDRIDTWRSEVGLHTLRVEELEKRSANDPEGGSLLVRAASVSATKLEDYPRATDLMRKAVEVAPSLERFHRLREYAALAGLADERRFAIDACLKGESSTERRVALLIELADCEEATNAAAAREALRRAFDLSNDASVRERLFALCVSDGDTTAARALLMTGVRRSSDAVEIAELRERIANLPGEDSTSAIDAWNEVLVYRPSSFEAHRKLETLTLDAPRERGRSLALAGQLGASSDDRLDHMLVMASAWQGANGFAESAAVLEQVLAIEPTHADALDALVMLYEVSGQLELARVTLDVGAFHAEGARRIGLLRRAQDLLPEDATAERWAYERRISWLAEGRVPDPAAVESLAKAADCVSAWISLRRHAWMAAPSSERQDDSDALLAVLTDVAADPRAALAHVRARVDSRPASNGELAIIRDLCEKCGDHSELIELLEQRVARAGSDKERATALDSLATELARLERPVDAIEALHRALVVAGDNEGRMKRLSDIAESSGSLVLRDQIWLQVAMTVGGARRAELLNEWADSKVSLSGPDRFARRMMSARIAGLSGQRLVDLSSDAASLGVWPWVCAFFEAEARGRTTSAAQQAGLAAVAAAMSGSTECAQRELELHGELLLADPASTVHAAALLEGALALNRQREARLWLRSAAEQSDDATAVRLLESAWTLTDEVEQRSRIAAQLLLHDANHLPALELLTEQADAAGDCLELRSLLLRRAELVEDSAAKARLLERAAAVSSGNLEESRRAIELYDLAAELDANTEAAAARVALIESHGTPEERLALARKRADEDGESAVERLLELAAIQRTNGSVDDAIDSLTLAYERGADVWDELSAELQRTKRSESLLTLQLQRARSMEVGEARGDAFGECLALLSSTAEDELREEVLREAVSSPVFGARARASLTELLLSAGRYEELRDGLAERIVSASPDARLDLQVTLARIQRFNLEEADSSLDLWLDVHGEHPENAASLLALASLAETREDYARAFDWRYQYAHLLVPRDGALSLCALAEYCGDHSVHSERVADLYREARRLDPWCAPSSEALKGISRRLSSLRPKAALLDEAGEGDLTAAQRAARLHELATSAAETADEVNYLRRAVALDPERWQAWQRLAELDGGSTTDEYYRFRLAAWDAWRITMPLGDEERATDVELGWQAATAANKAGEPEEFRRICAAIHLVAPTYLPAAQVIARAALEQGDAESALTIVAPMAAHASQSEDAALLSLFGDIYAANGDRDEAEVWHSRAVALRPMASNSLAALADVAHSAGDFAGYQNLILGSLTGEPEPGVHADRLYALAKELESRGESAEATACYEEAFTWGQRDGELLERLYAQYQTQAAGPRGRSVIAALLESGVSEERAQVLHLSLGRLLVEQGEDLVTASTHLRAVLELNDEMHEARTLLATAYDKSGDDAGLRQVLEELAERATGRAAADAWLKLGELHERAGDIRSAQTCLERSVEAFPTAAAMNSLEAEWSTTEPGSGRRRANLSRLAEVDAVCWPHVLAAARPILDSDSVAGWCALSPLLMTRQGEDELRGRLREMRRDFERPPIRVARPVELNEWLPAQTSERVAAVMGALAALESAGLELNGSAEDIGAEEVFEVSSHSSIGRTFLAVAAECGLNDVCLYRAGTLPQAFMHWHTGPTLNVVVRADVFQSMARAEVGFVLVGLLAQATGAGRTLAGIPAKRRAGFGAAVGAWLSDEPSTSADQDALVALSEVPDTVKEAIRQTAPPSLWSDASLMEETAFVIAQKALRRSLVAGPDLYQVGRALARMGNDATRATSFADVDELDAVLRGDAHLRLLAAFSVSEAFSRALQSASEVSS